jgi:hypothetical protein
MHKAFFAVTSVVICLILVSGCAVSNPPLPAPPQPALPNVEFQCGAFRESARKISNTDRSVESGWVEVQYALDGSGRASNLVVISSHNARGFTDSVVADIRNADFKRDVKVLRVESCDFEFTAAGLSRTAKGYTDSYTWQEVVAVHKLSRAYLIEFEVGAMPIPFRVFSGNEQQRMENFVPQALL